MILQRSTGEKVFNLCNIIFLVVLMIVTLYPLIFVLFASISDPIEIMKHKGIMLAPKGFELGAYKLVFENPMITIGYKNTLLYLIAGTVLNLFLTTLAAYGLSRKNVMLKNGIMFMIVFTMFFNGGLVPTYLLVKDIGMIDSRLAMIIPRAVSAWNLIIMRTSFEGVSDSLVESARIEGANDFTILWKIIVPVSKAVMAVIVLFYGVYHWNAWFDAMIYLRDRKLYPLQLVLREILISNDTGKMTTYVVDVVDKEPIGETIKYSTIVVATLPILLAYPFLQKYFVKGVMIGAIKG